ncbi:Thioredoxin [Nibea albiflora]|uniref:Thioredoxin n=1 Tax=Nibea albiflora TaxID=240163 RepID=A0ACB7EV45_NIBAL|nr:Thioredoxin [Nibea albiflora]
MAPQRHLGSLVTEPPPLTKFRVETRPSVATCISPGPTKKPLGDPGYNEAYGVHFVSKLAVFVFSSFHPVCLKLGEDFKTILKEAGNKLVVVDFTAAWCGPCKNIGPVFVEHSKKPENQNVIFLKVDVDDAEDVSAHCQINCMPTFHFYKNGEKVDEFSGANPNTLAEKLERHR